MNSKQGQIHEFTFEREGDSFHDWIVWADEDKANVIASAAGVVKVEKSSSFATKFFVTVDHRFNGHIVMDNVRLALEEAIK